MQQKREKQSDPYLVYLMSYKIVLMNRDIENL